MGMLNEKNGHAKNSSGAFGAKSRQLVPTPSQLIGGSGGGGGGRGRDLALSAPRGLGLGLGSPSWFPRSVLQHLFRSQGGENILAASSSKQAASSSKQAASSSKQAATELISAYPHISINIDGTSPKLLW